MADQQITIQVEENKIINVTDVLGTLRKADAAPTVKGLYFLEEVGNYTNLGLVAQDMRLNYATFDGTNWRLSYKNLPSPNVTNINNSYNVDPEQIVPSEALYNDETLAGDIMKRVDKNTGENVNYRETNVWIDGTTMNDAKVDGAVFIKNNGKYLRRNIDNGVINASWFGNDDLAIQKAINIAIGNSNGTKIPYYSVYIPAGFWNINNKILIEKTQWLNIYGDGASTKININADLDCVFDFNSFAHSTFGHLIVTSLSNKIVEDVIRIRWDDGNNVTNGRSTTHNVFTDIQIFGELKYKNGINIMGHNDVSQCRFDNILVTGNKNSSVITDRWENAFKVGDSIAANNLSHLFTNCKGFNVENIFDISGAGGIIIGVGGQNAKRYIKRSAPSHESLMVLGGRLEGIERIYEATVRNAFSDNVTLKGIWYSGISGSGFGAPSDGKIIIGSGMINIEGCKFVDPHENAPFVIEAENAFAGTEENVISVINISGLFVERENISGLLNSWNGTKCVFNINGLVLIDEQQNPIQYITNFTTSIYCSQEPHEQKKYTEYGKWFGFFNKNGNKGFNFYQDNVSHIVGESSGGLYLENFPFVVASRFLGDYQLNEYEDTSAPDNIMYYSTTQSKVVFKKNGVINALY